MDSETGSEKPKPVQPEELPGEILVGKVKLRRTGDFQYRDQNCQFCIWSYTGRSQWSASLFWPYGGNRYGYGPTQEMAAKDLEVRLGQDFAQLKTWLGL